VRWFVVFLVVANLVLYFWVKQQSLPPPGVSALAPPDIGRLRLLSELHGRSDGSMPDSSVPPTGATNDGAAAEKAPPEIVMDVGEMDVAPVPAAGPISNRELSADQETAIPTLQAESTPIPPQQQVVVDPGADREADAMEGSSDTSVKKDPTYPQGAVATFPPADSSVSDKKADTVGAVVATLRPEVLSPSCARVGPFTAHEADTLIAYLPEHLTLYSDIVEEYTMADSYYVMIAALPSREEGNRKIQELADAGVKDTWLFRSGEYRNAISLGLFTREASANRHAENIRKKGFPNQVIPRGVRKEGRWLYLRNRDGGDIGLSLPLPDGASAERLACP